MATQSNFDSEPRKLYRSRFNRMIGGVCAGTAEYFGMDVTLVRVIWAISVFIQGIGILAYLACLILVPENPDTMAHVTTKQKPLKATDQTAAKQPQQNTRLIIGVVLILFGLMLLSKEAYFWVFDWHFLRFWPFSVSYFFPVLLILFGALYIVHILRKDERINGSKMPQPSSSRRLFRSKKDKMLNGVCSGLAKLWNVDAALIRVGWVIGTVLTGIWIGVVVYVVMIFTVPEETNDVPKPASSSPAEKSKAPNKTSQKNKKTM